MAAEGEAEAEVEAEADDRGSEDRKGSDGTYSFSLIFGCSFGLGLLFCGGAHGEERTKKYENKKMTTQLISTKMKTLVVEVCW